MLKRIILSAFVTVFLVGCSTDNGNTPVSFDNENYQVSEPAMDMSSKEATTVNGQSTEDVSLIHTANVSLQTISYQEDKQSLLDLLANSSASIQYQDEYQNTYNYSSASTAEKRLFNLNLTVRVPDEDFESLLEQLTTASIGEMVGTSRGSEDVTRSVRDNQIRLESIDARIERLNDLLDQAENIADIIEIQNSLDSAILERDQILSDQDYLNDQVDRSTITITLREVMELEDGITSQRNFWDELVRALAETGYRAIDVLQQGILSLVFILPYLLFIVLLYLIYRWVVKPIFKAIGFKNPFRRNKRKEPRIKSTENYPISESDTNPLPTQDEKDDLPPGVN